MSYLEDILEQLKKEGHFETKKNKPNVGISQEACDILEIIDKFELNFNLGTALSQILSSNSSISKLDRLMIAVWYIEWEIEKLEKN